MAPNYQTEMKPILPLGLPPPYVPVLSIPVYLGMVGIIIAFIALISLIISKEDNPDGTNAICIGMYAVVGLLIIIFLMITSTFVGYKDLVSGNPRF